MYHDIDYYFKSIFYERPDISTNLLCDLFSIKSITDIKIIKIKEQHPKLIIPDFVIHFKINNQKYLLNIEFQSKLTKESILKAILYNILLKQEYKYPVLSVILSIDKNYINKEPVFYYKINESLKTLNNKNIKFLKFEIIVINLLNPKIKEIVSKGNYLGLLELIESYTNEYNLNKLKEIIEIIEERVKEGIYKEKEEIMLKIIIGMMYIKRSSLSQEEVLKMLKIDKKEKEKIRKMYKDNPVLQFLTQTIFEDEIKKYQQLLKQKELEAKQKELEAKQKEELLKQKELEAKQKELEAKQKEELLKQRELEAKQKEELLKQKELEAKKIALEKEKEIKQKELEKEMEKEREIIEILLKFKVKDKIDEIILKIQKIEDLSKLNKIRKILELELLKDEYLNHIEEILNS